MKYHWIMTVRNGMRMDTLDGDVDVTPGTTRSDVYESIKQRAFAEARIGKAAVLFFSLEPDSLEGPASWKTCRFCGRPIARSESSGLWWAVDGHPVGDDPDCAHEPEG